MTLDAAGVTPAAARADHRHRRPGRLLPGRALCARASRCMASSRALARATANLAAVRASLHLHVADLLEPGALRGSSPRLRRTRSTTSRRRHSCRFVARAGAHDAGDRRRDRRADRRGPRPVPPVRRRASRAPARSSARPRRARSTRTRPALPSTPYGVGEARRASARRLVARARWPTRCPPRSCSTTNPRGARPQFVSARSRARSRPSAWGVSDGSSLGDLAAVRDWSAAVDVGAACG